MEKRVVIALIIAVIIVAPTIYYIHNSYISNNSNAYDYLTIDISIVSNSSSEKTIYLPVPVIGFANSVYENEGMPIEEIDNITIVSGNGTKTIIEENGEYFLLINYSDSIHIIFNETYGYGEISPRPFDSLSSEQLFFNSTGIPDSVVSYHIQYSVNNVIGTFNLQNYSAELGWQYVDITSEIMIIN